MDSVVVAVGKVDSDCLEEHPISIGPSLDTVGVCNHGVPGAAQWTGLCHTATGPTVLHTDPWRERERGGGEGRDERED